MNNLQLIDNIYDCEMHVVSVLDIYEGSLKSSWTGGSAPLLCRGMQ
jgi:hypothetical protein